VSNLSHYNIVLSKLKNDALFNPIKFLLENQRIIKYIKTTSNLFKITYTRIFI